MEAAELNRWLATVARLTPAQKVELLKALSARDDETDVGQLVDSRLAQSPACPHCASTRIVHNGSASGLQRFKCRACQRTFNALSKTPLARLRKKGKWLQQEDALARGLIVRLASAELGVAPSTAFRWRHRFLQLAQPIKALVLTGVVEAEADETFFLRSSKGQRPGRAPRERGGRASRKDRGEDLMPVLVARDRSGATADFLLEAVSKKCLGDVLRPRVKADAILCTDGSAAMAATAKEMGVHHEAINLSAGERVRGPWHRSSAWSAASLPRPSVSGPRPIWSRAPACAAMAWAASRPWLMPAACTCPWSWATCFPATCPNSSGSTPCWAISRPR